MIIRCLFFSHSLSLLFLPLRDVLVEGRRAAEHLAHVGDVGGVPSDSWWGIEVKGVFVCDYSFISSSLPSLLTTSRCPG